MGYNHKNKKTEATKPKKCQNRRMKNSFGATDILNEHEIGEVKNLENRNELLQNDIEHL